MKEKWNRWLPFLFLALFALTRWPGLMPLNFSAAYALCFCAGVYFPGRLAWWLPLGTLLLTDVLLNGLYYHYPIFNAYLLINYLGYAALILVGRKFTRQTSWLKLVSGGMLGAILFYVITNTAAWLYEPTQPYPKTPTGWWQALTIGTAGWPETWKFFRNTLLSGGLFSGLFAAAMKLTAESSQQVPSEAEAETETTDAAPEEAKA